MRAIALAAAGLMVLAGAALRRWDSPTRASRRGSPAGRRRPSGRASTPEPANDCQGIEGDPKRAICVVGSDTFTPEGGSPVTVQPLDGTKMVRLGGPFTSADQDQLQDRYRLKQTFTVDPAKPVLQLNYNVFVFDYSGFDEARFNVRLTDENGAPITDFVQGGFGSGTLLKNTGWRRAFIDLSGYEGQQVHLTIDSGGTEDELTARPYVDAGEAPAAPVSPPTVTAPNLPGTTTPAPFNTFADPASGQVYIAIPNSVVSKFPNGCMPLDLSVPIAAGNGTVKDVLLIGQGAPIPMTFAGGKLERAHRLRHVG